MKWEDLLLFLNIFYLLETPWKKFTEKSVSEHEYEVKVLKSVWPHFKRVSET